MLKLLDSLLWRNVTLGSSLELDSALALDEPPNELRHFSFLDLAIAIFIELLEKDIELVYGNSGLALELHELVQKVESLQLVESSAVVSIVPSPDGVNERVSLIIRLVGKSHLPPQLLDGLILILELGLKIADLSVLLSQLALELDHIGRIEALLLKLELFVLLLSHVQLLLVISSNLGKTHAFGDQLLDVCAALRVVATLFCGLGPVFTFIGEGGSVEIWTLVVVHEVIAFGFSLSE